MRSVYLIFILLSGLLLSGCAGGFRHKKEPDQSQDTVVPRPADVETILACLADDQKLSRKDFKLSYKLVSSEAAGGDDADTLRLLCLSLHHHASYKQFKDGMETLSLYIKEHPESAASLQGLLLLMQRIDREKVIKWAQSNKSLDEKEELEAENKELLDRNEVLETSAAQDKVRIKELQNQIEQLKNIENIIKNRER